MKKLFCILTLLCFACSSSDDSDNPSTTTLEVSVIGDVTTVSIDQIITLTATANEAINEISFSTDGGATFPSSSNNNFGTTANLYFSFDTLGTKSIVFRVKNEAGDIVDTTVNIIVERGSAIQLQNLQLNSFFDIGNTWDSEYPTTDPSHLADVFFVILKPSLNVFTGMRNGISSTSQIWYRSSTRDNENNLNWDLQNDELYINVEELITYIAFADEDGGGIVDDLMLGPPFERMIPLGENFISQPNTITVEEPSINLEYVLGVDW